MYMCKWRLIKFNEDMELLAVGMPRFSTHFCPEDAIFGGRARFILWCTRTQKENEVVGEV